MNSITNRLESLEIVEEKPEKKKYVEKKCPHGKRPDRCPEESCGGKPEKKCPHGKPPYRCVPCGGKPQEKREEKKCPHGKRPDRCPEESCGGTIKPKYVYEYVKKECIHGRTLGRCTICGGVQICEHEKVKSKCTLCQGAQICEHTRVRNVCKECYIAGTGGASICIHNKEKTQCLECEGSSICEHHRKRAQCRECLDLGTGGVNFCVHGTRKSNCKICERSSQVCEHGNFRSFCLECPMGDKIKYAICKICVDKVLGGRFRKAGICFQCETDTPPRTEVTFGNMIIEKLGFEPNCKDKSLSTGAKCKGLDHRRPDLLWVIENKVAVVVEIDEDSHSSGYEPSCEIRKISEQNLAIQQLDDCENIPVYTIRVNPDAYDKKRITLKTRAETVAKKVREILDDDSHERQGYAKIFFYCYHSKADHIIEAQRKHWNVEILD